jgi:molybdopterin-guanine dinucleotide biosynthesis protein MobB
MLAISGFSGSGKTTLIEGLLPRLRVRGLAVGVIKHDAHRLEFDTPGKDSHRMRVAGASRVEAFDARWWFQVAPSPPGAGWDRLPPALRRDLDLLLVEGGKSGSMDKVWLREPGGAEPPGDVAGVVAVLDRAERLLDRAERTVATWLERRWARAERAVTVLAGGASSRMGTSKAALRIGGRSMLGRVVDRARAFCSDVVVAGVPPGGMPADVDAPLLPDVPGVRGPVGGMLAAMRWSPGRGSIVVACDMPRLDGELLERIWACRRPGVWAVIPRQPDGRPGVLAAAYEPQAGCVLEQAVAQGLRSPWDIFVDHTKTAMVELEDSEGLGDVDRPEDVPGGERGT